MATKLVKKTVITEEYVAEPEKRSKAADRSDEDLMEGLGDLTDDEDCDEEDDVEPSPSSRSHSRRSR